MHASENWANVARTLFAHLAALSLPSGCALVPADDTRFNSDEVSSFVRVQLEHDPGVFAGVTSGRKTQRVRVNVIAECWARLPEDAAGGTLDTVDTLAATVRAGFSFSDIALKDYVTDSTGATAAGGVLRSVPTPEIQTAPPFSGWARRTVFATFHWWPQHEA